MKTDKGYTTIQIELSDSEFLQLAKLAHEQNITFNKLCQNILKEYIKKYDHDEKQKRKNN